MIDLTASGAIFSDCRTYRYVLWRIWDQQSELVSFIGLNPSNANESKDDQTIRKVTRLTKNWNFGGLIMVNLYAYITPYPNELIKVKDPIADNDIWLEKYLPECQKIIFAWGASPLAEQRAKLITESWNGCSLGYNKNGSPKHPLYIKDTTGPIRFERL